MSYVIVKNDGPPYILVPVPSEQPAYFYALWHWAEPIHFAVAIPGVKYEQDRAGYGR